jgi:hypothetical protein
MTFSKQLVLLKKWLASTIIIALVVAAGSFGFLYSRGKGGVSPLNASESFYFYPKTTEPYAINSIVSNVAQTMQVVMTSKEFLEPVSKETGLDSDKLASLVTVANATVGTSTASVSSIVNITFSYAKKDMAEKILDSYSDEITNYMNRNTSNNAFFNVVGVNGMNKTITEALSDEKRTTTLKHLILSLLAGIIVSYGIFALRAFNYDSGLTKVISNGAEKKS